MNNNTLDFSKKIFLKESFKENYTSGQFFPFKIQYGNDIEYSFYEKAIFAAKETILRKVNRQIKLSNEDDQFVYVKNILFGPNEVFSDALYNLAKAYVRACCIFASIPDKSPEDFEKDYCDLIENVAIDGIEFKNADYNKLYMNVSFYYDYRNKLEPSLYPENYDDCQFGDYHAVKVATICIKLAVLDIYKTSFKRESKREIEAKRGDTAFEIVYKNKVDERFIKIKENLANDLFRNSLPRSKEILYDRLVLIYKRNDSSTFIDKPCRSCNKFSQKESNCGGANLDAERVIHQQSNDIETREKILNGKFFKIKTGDFTSLCIPEEIADHFVSTKYNWIEWAYKIIASKLARCDIAVDYCKE